MSEIKPSKKISFNIVFLALSAGLLGFAFYGFHDAQMAQGAGLYISLELNLAQRTACDILIDCLGILLIILATLLPPVLLKQCTPSSYLRFVCLFLALAPMINPGTLVHIFSQFSNWTLRQELWSQGFIYGLKAFMSLLFIEAPLFLLLLMIHKQEEKYKLQKHTGILLILSALSCLLYFLFPGFEEYTFFLSHYFILILIFEEIELLLKKTSKYSQIAWIFYLLCGLRGIYRIIILLQTTHM